MTLSHHHSGQKPWSDLSLLILSQSISKTHELNKHCISRIFPPASTATILVQATTISHMGYYNRVRRGPPPLLVLLFSLFLTQQARCF